MLKMSLLGSMYDIVSTDLRLSCRHSPLARNIYALCTKFAQICHQMFKTKSCGGGGQWLFEHHVTKCFKSDKLKCMQCNCLSTNLANIGGEIGEEVSKSAVVRADHKLDENTTKQTPQTSAKAQRVKIKH